MARIAGVMLPRNKWVLYGLTYLFGVGLNKSKKILTECKIPYETLTDNLTEEQVAKIRGAIENREKVEGDLKREIQLNIKRLMDLGCYRGLRHRRGLPVRGQRTRTNARTRKGPRKMAVVKKKVV